MENADHRCGYRDEPECGSGRAGVVDIGSSTATLALYRAGPAGSVDRAEQLGYPLRLIRALDREGVLRAEAVDRIVDSVREFSARADAFGASCLGAFATSAIRDAVNGEEVARTVERRTGVELRILSGEEEGRAAAVSALHTLPFEDGLVVDLGGGSLQLVRVSGGRIHQAVSLPLGALRTADAFLAADPPTGHEVAALRQHATELLAGERWVAEAGPVVVGVGGTLRALAKLERRERGSAIRHAHGFELHGDQLLRWIDVLTRLPRDRRSRVPGLASHRVDSVVAGAVVAWAVLRAARAEGVLLSTYGLREGFAIEALHPEGGRDPRAAGLEGRFPCADHRARDVSRRALSLLDASGVEVDLAERTGLTLAAWVVGSGATHLDRLLLEPIPGFTQAQVLFAARLLGLVAGEDHRALQTILDQAAGGR